MNKVRIGLYKSIAKSDTCVHVTFPEDSCGGILNELMGIMHMLNRNIESGRLRQYAGPSYKKEWLTHASLLLKLLENVASCTFGLTELLYETIKDLAPMTKANPLYNGIISSGFTLGTIDGVKRAYDIDLDTCTISMNGVIKKTNVPKNTPAYLKDLDPSPEIYFPNKVSFINLEDMVRVIRHSAKKCRRYIYYDKDTECAYVMERPQYPYDINSAVEKMLLGEWKIRS